MPAQTAAAPALSRAHRRAIEKDARRAPKATIHRIARLLESDDEITQQDIDDVRACSAVLRRLSGELTLGEARAYLDETCIRIEVERAGLCDSIEMETTGHGL